VDAPTERLPIYEAVLSQWFEATDTGSHKRLGEAPARNGGNGTTGTTAANGANGAGTGDSPETPEDVARAGRPSRRSTRSRNRGLAGR